MESIEEKTYKLSSTDKFLMVVFIVLIGSAFISNFYHFYINKNYTYIIETECDSEFETCYIGEDEGGQFFYNVKTINAYDFSACSDNSCTNECTSGFLECITIPCGTDPADVCSKNE